MVVGRRVVVAFVLFANGIVGSQERSSTTQTHPPWKGLVEEVVCVRQQHTLSTIYTCSLSHVLLCSPSHTASLDEASEEAVAAGERAIASLVRQLEVTGPGNSTAQQQQQATQPAQPPQPPQQQQQQPPQEYRSTRGSFVLPQRALPSSVGVIQEEQGGEGDEPVSPLLAAATGRPLAMAHVDEAPALGVGGVGAGVGAGAGAGATVGVPTGAAMQQSAAGGTLRRQHGSNPILFPELGIRHSRSQVLMLESNVEEQFLSRLSRHMYSPSRDAASPRRSVSHDSATEDNTYPVYVTPSAERKCVCCLFHRVNLLRP